MVYCLNASINCMKRHWIDINEICWQSLEGNFTRDTQPLLAKITLKNTVLKFDSNLLNNTLWLRKSTHHWVTGDMNRRIRVALTIISYRGQNNHSVTYTYMPHSRNIMILYTHSQCVYPYENCLIVFSKTKYISLNVCHVGSLCTLLVWPCCDVFLFQYKG